MYTKGGEQWVKTHVYPKDAKGNENAMTDQNNWTPDSSEEALDQDNNVDAAETTIDNVINEPDAADTEPDTAASEVSDTASGIDAPLTPDAAALDADEEYEDNFIENPNNASSPAAPVAPLTLPGAADTAPPARPASTPENRANVATPTSAGNGGNAAGNANEANMESRLERLGGEPAPVITPEEFARLQKAGQVHIDERGRVRTARRSDSEADAGVSLRKRRAWYGEVRSH